MAITVASIQTPLNTYLGDDSTDRISAAERLSAITEATIWLAEELVNDHQRATYELSFLDTVNYYKITTAVPDLLATGDLRVSDIDDNILPFTRKSPEELAIEIGQNNIEWSYATEYRDSDYYLVVNYQPKYRAKAIAGFNSITEDGTWALDETTADGTNLTLDTVEFKQGSGSLNFDIDVSQSGNNLATLSNSTISTKDLSEFEDLGSHVMRVYIPDVTNFTSVTLYWGDDSSNYWSATVTTDIEGAAWVNGWNRIKVNWEDATKTSSPTASTVEYLRIDFNYGGGQGDDTDFRVDDWIITRPEKLKFHYLSWNVGTNTGGTDILTFGATTDIPYFSGQYDQYIYPVAHKATAILLRSLGLPKQAAEEDLVAERELRVKEKIFPKGLRQEVKSFKVKGLNLRNRNRRGRRII